MNNKSSLRTFFLYMIMLIQPVAFNLAAEKKNMTAEKAADALIWVISESALESLPDPFISRLPKKEIPTPDAEKKAPPPDQWSDPLTPPLPSKVPPSNKPLPPTVPRPNPAQDTQVSMAEPTLTLTGIVFNTAKPQAVINGTVVSVGDRIAGVEVKSISKGVVEVKFAGGMLKLEMNQPKK